MIYQELKDFLQTLTPEQLQQQIPVFITDDEEESPKMLQSWEVSQDDIYWEHHGDCLGTLEEAKKQMGEDFDEEDLIKVPKGTVMLHAE